jgi:hypothetical protein
LPKADRFVQLNNPDGEYNGKHDSKLPPPPQKRLPPPPLPQMPNVLSPSPINRSPSPIGASPSQSQSPGAHGSCCKL